ncbi:MAG: LamG domain-containing protein, partial [Planctomycetes bacterium]|nr:LamG domain-containing protein [Planctomycetota bacterium]
MRARLISCLMVLFLVTQASADLVGCWKLNDGAGTKAADSSGNGHHGTLISGPQWAAGYYGGALQFNGQNSYVEIPTAPQLEIRGQVTVAAWVNWANAGDTWLAILANGQQNGPWENYGLFVNRSSRFAYFTLSLNDAHVNQQTANNTIEAGRWQHLCGTWDGTAARIYVDGKLLLTQARTGALTSPRMPLRLGHRNGSVHYYSGLLDEVAVFDHALTAEEIQKAMLGIAPPELAADPQPGDGAVDVPRDATLGWTPGRLAATHDVYFGTTRADVNAAGRTDPKGVLAGQGQTEATFDPPGLLAYGQTYSWRVDEVNRAPDNTIFKGEVWSFTAEPYSYPVKPVKATASSYQMNMGPEKTIDGSGLTG